jgi:2-aminoethylphosphonate-pyruvate transaminase
MTAINPHRDKLLFTPGPLTTSPAVKASMLRDLGSRDTEFLTVVREIRERLLFLGGDGPGGDYECILMQGSGTFAIESVISSAIPRDGRLLVLVNGAYGRRIAQMAQIHGIATETLETPENRKIAPTDVAARLAASPGFTHVAVVHCETTTGILNPIQEIGAAVARTGAAYIIDAMSSFGAIPIDLAANHAAFLVSSANKCIEGAPGFAFVLARGANLVAAEGRARTLSLDLHAQWSGFERNGQFRFTPPTHVLLAFYEALLELEEEGGVKARAARYRANHAALTKGMAALGFEAYIAPADQSYIITSYRYPRDPGFRFEDFYARLSATGFVIYPGKLTNELCFRIGTIGRLTPADIESLLVAIGEATAEFAAPAAVQEAHLQL